MGKSKLEEGYKLYLQQTGIYITKEELVELKCPNHISNKWLERKWSSNCCDDCNKCWGWNNT